MVQQDERTQQALSYIRHQASKSLAELRVVFIELADPSTTSSPDRRRRSQCLPGEMSHEGGAATSPASPLTRLLPFCSHKSPKQRVRNRAKQDEDRRTNRQRETARCRTLFPHDQRVTVALAPTAIRRAARARVSSRWTAPLMAPRRGRSNDGGTDDDRRTGREVDRSP